jgi:3-mercaptopyruvate sulfurtransferase SseA
MLTGSLPAGFVLTLRIAAMAAAMVFVATLGGCVPNISDKDIQDVPLASLQKSIEKQAAAKDKPLLLLIDSRSPKDFADGHLPDARNMQITAIPDKRGDIDRRLSRFDAIVIYGNDRGSAGPRALAKRMLGVGYENVGVFMGGIEEWRRANLPLVKAAPPAGQ